MVEASLVAESTCLGKIMIECIKLHRMLVEAWSQREKDLADA